MDIRKVFETLSYVSLARMDDDYKDGKYFQLFLSDTAQNDEIILYLTEEQVDTLAGILSHRFDIEKPGDTIRNSQTYGTTIDKKL